MGTDAKNIVKCPSAPWLKQDYIAGLSRDKRGFAYI